MASTPSTLDEVIITGQYPVTGTTWFINQQGLPNPATQSADYMGWLLAHPAVTGGSNVQWFPSVQTPTFSGSPSSGYTGSGGGYLSAIQSGSTSASDWIVAGLPAIAINPEPVLKLVKPDASVSFKTYAASNEGLSSALNTGENLSGSKQPVLSKVVTQFDSLLNESPLAKAIAKAAINNPVTRLLSGLIAGLSLPFDLLWPTSIAPDPNVVRYKPTMPGQMPGELEEVVITAELRPDYKPAPNKPPVIVPPSGIVPLIPPIPKVTPPTFPKVIPFTPNVSDPFLDVSPENNPKINPKLDPAPSADLQKPPKFPPRFPPEFPPNFFIPPIPPKTKPWTPNIPNVGTLPDVTGMLEPAPDLKPQPDYDLAGNKCPPCKKAKEENEKKRQTCYVKLVREHTTPSNDTSYNWRKIPCQ